MTSELVACPVIELGPEFEVNEESIKRSLHLKFGDSATFLFNSSNFPWDEACVVCQGDNKQVRDTKEFERRALVTRFDAAATRNTELCVHLVDMLSVEARNAAISDDQFNLAVEQSNPILLWETIKRICSMHIPVENEDQVGSRREVGGLKLTC